MTGKEDWIAQRWPNEAQRKERREKLFARLNVFLDAFVETKDSGWAAATKSEVSELADIWREIADLKFERDVDGDSVINFDVVNRQHGRLVSTFVPYRPRDGRLGEEPVQPIDQVEFVKDSLRAARYLISSGEDVMRSLDFDMDDIGKRLPPTERLCVAEPRVISLIEKGYPAANAEGVIDTYTPLSWKDALTEVETFSRTFPDAREAQERVKQVFLAAYGQTPEFVAANAEIIDMVSTGRLNDAREILFAHRKLYGVGIREGITAYNEAERAAARARLEESRARRAAEKAAEGSDAD